MCEKFVLLISSLIMIGVVIVDRLLIRLNMLFVRLSSCVGVSFDMSDYVIDVKLLLKNVIVMNVII